jgi:hypothetical protein
MQLRESTLQLVVDKLPGAMPALAPLLWSLIHGSLWLSPALIDTLDDAAFWSMHVRPLLIPFPMLIERMTEDRLRALTTLGSLDAVAALWCVLLAAIEDKRDTDALIASRYLPPAIALLSCRAETQRIAPLIFARCRQLVLDRVSAAEMRLDLFEYDLSRAARSALGWQPGLQFAATDRAREWTKQPLAPAVAAWLADWLAPLTTHSRHGGVKWAKACRPSADVHVTGMAPQALQVIRTALGGYF